MAYQSWRTQPQLQLASSVLNCVQEDAILRSHGPQAHLQVIISTLFSRIYKQILAVVLTLVKDFLMARSIQAKNGGFLLLILPELRKFAMFA